MQINAVPSKQGMTRFKAIQWAADIFANNLLIKFKPERQF